MLIITKTPASNGAYPPLQDWSGLVAPEGYYKWPDGLDTAEFYQYNGFVTLTVVRGMVQSYQPNTEAWEAWKENLPPEPEPEPTVEDVTLDMLADHEERLCMLELTTTTV